MSIRYPIIVLLVIIIVTIVTVLSIPRVKRSINYEHPRQLQTNHPNHNVIVIEMEEMVSNTSDGAKEPLAASSSDEYEEMITIPPEIQDNSEVTSTATKDESVTATNLFGPVSIFFLNFYYGWSHSGSEDSPLNFDANTVQY